jgi:hypothetical protein
MLLHSNGKQDKRNPVFDAERCALQATGLEARGEFWVYDAKPVSYFR